MVWGERPSGGVKCFCDSGFDDWRVELVICKVRSELNPCQMSHHDRTSDTSSDRMFMTCVLNSEERPLLFYLREIRGKLVFTVRKFLSAATICFRLFFFSLNIHV